MPRAGSRITAVVGTYKAFLTFLMGMGSLKVQFCSAVRTEHLARKDTDFSRCGRATFVFADFLYRLKDMPSSRSFRCNRLSGNKKAGTQMRTDFPQKG